MHCSRPAARHRGPARAERDVKAAHRRLRWSCSSYCWRDSGLPARENAASGRCTNSRVRKRTFSSCQAGCLVFKHQRELAVWCTWRCRAMAFDCCLPTALIFALVNSERAGGAGRIRVRSWSACGSFRTPGGKLAGGAGAQLRGLSSPRTRRHPTRGGRTFPA